MPALPILMYHKVGAPVRDKADTFLNVSERSFARQMRLLRRMGCTGITFADGVQRLAGQRSLPRRPVCVTFDDGYANVAQLAAPILAQYGWPGTVFVPTAYVGGHNRWDVESGKPLLPIMDWDALAALQGQGWEMAGHTHSHPHLDLLADDDALAEMRRGRDELRQRLSAPVATFCYPFGSVNARTPGLARDAGFSGACTTRSGLARSSTDPFQLPRVKIAYRDDVCGLAYRLLVRPHLP